MDCENSKLLISRQVDSALGEKEALRLERHISQCPACASFREDLYRLGSFFSAEAPPAPSPDLRERTLQAARRELAAKRTGLVPVFLRRLAVAALLLSALTIGLLMVSTDAIQAVDANGEIHYEDLFQRASAGDGSLLEALLITTDPGQALKCYSAAREAKP